MLRLIIYTFKKGNVKKRVKHSQYYYTSKAVKTMIESEEECENVQMRARERRGRDARMNVKLMNGLGENGGELNVDAAVVAVIVLGNERATMKSRTTIHGAKPREPIAIRHSYRCNTHVITLLSHDLASWLGSR